MVAFVVALNRVNIVALSPILVSHVGVIEHHVLRHQGFMFPRRSGNARLRARGSGTPWPPEREVWGVLPPAPAQQGGSGGRRPPKGWRCICKTFYAVSHVDVILWCHFHMSSMFSASSDDTEGGIFEARAPYWPFKCLLVIFW